MPRDSGRVRGSKAEDEEYVLVVKDVPGSCKWQELKDLVRQTATHARQAVVHEGRVGQVTVRNRDEAFRTYRYLVKNGWNGQSITVSLTRPAAQKDQPLIQVAGPATGPSKIAQGTYAASNFSSPPPTSSGSVCSSPTSPLSPVREKHNPMVRYQQSEDYVGYLPATNGVTVNGRYPPQQMSFVALNPSQVPPVVQPHMAMVAMPMGVGYDSTILPAPYGTAPIPAQYAAMQRTPATTQISAKTPTTPSRNIFVQNLSPDASWQNLKDLLRKVGHAERCEVPTDSHGRSKGCATASFRTKEGAEAAVQRLNETKFMGTKLKVHFERASPRYTTERERERDRTGSKTSSKTTRDAAEPLVVDGSAASAKVAKMANSESSDDDEDGVKHITHATRDIRVH